MISLIFLPSCGATINGHFALKNKLPFDSFVKVVATYDVVKCVGETCMNFKLGATSSGAVVRAYDHGTYILTTGHSCDPRAILHDLGGNAKIKQKSIWIGVDGSLHHDRWGFVVLCHFHPDGSGHAETHASRGYRRPSCTVWCYSLGQFPLGQIPLHRLASCPHGACRLCHSLTVD